MANSRKSRPLTEPVADDTTAATIAATIAVFKRALEAILARVVVSLRPRAIAVAFSGGLDSSVLLQLASQYTAAQGIRLHAFHIHHGISPNADAWLAHAAEQASRVGADFAAQRVALNDPAGRGVEQAARIARYAALGELCRSHQVALLVTAHHQDDQAETVLLQLMRGAGLPGLSGMPAIYQDTALTGEHVSIGRPLLDITRAQLEELAQAQGIEVISDESNHDTRYRRNAVRQLIAPVIEQNFPGFAARLARSSHHAQAAQRLLDELAATDFHACRLGDALSVEALARLSPDRFDNLLRYWLRQQGVRMPSTAQMDQLRSQMLAARGDRHPRFTLPDKTLERRRGLLVFVETQTTRPPEEPLMLRWQGEPALDVPDWCGRLIFDVSVSAGIDRERLLTGPLALRPRRGSERLQLDSRRPSRSLKNLYQEAAIAPRDRAWLPLLYGGDTLVFAAGLGLDVRLQAKGQGISLRWERLG